MFDSHGELSGSGPPANGEIETAIPTQASIPLNSHAREYVWNLIHDGEVRPPSVSVEVYDHLTGAQAIGVIDSLDFRVSSGGVQFYAVDGDLVDYKPYYKSLADSSARFSSWKAWLRGAPLDGGKIIAWGSSDLSQKERLGFFRTLGSNLMGSRFCAKPDVGVETELLEAYRKGGGLISPPHISDQSAKRTAKSVLEGMDEAMALESNGAARISSSTILLAGWNGRIGREILADLLVCDCQICLVTKDKNEESIAKEKGIETVALRDVTRKRADVLIWSGPPSFLKGEMVRDLKVKVIGGPANDVVSSAAAYDLGKLIIPGALLTSGAVYLPKEELPTLDAIGPISREIVGRVFQRRNQLGVDSDGRTATLFDAMIAEAEIRRELIKTQFQSSDQSVNDVLT